MTKTQAKHGALLALAGLTIAWLLMTLLAAVGAASAEPMPASEVGQLVDAGPTLDAGMPIVVPPLDEHPLNFGSYIKGLWTNGAFVPAIIVVAFAVLIVLRKRIAWLAEGKRAAYSAAAFAFLATIAEPASRGTTPTLSMWLAGIGAALALLAKPVPKADE